MMTEELEFFNEESVAILTEEEKTLLCQCINSYGEGGHPYADCDTLRFFEKNYALSCMALAYYSGNMSEKGRNIAETLLAKFPNTKGGVN